MEKWVMEKVVGDRDLRAGMENDEKYDGMCETC